MEKIKLLLCIPSLVYGGAERTVVNLARYLNRSLFDIRVCCLSQGGPLMNQLEMANIKTYILGKRNRFDVRAFGRVAAVFREYQPDIIHCFLFTSAFWVAIPALLYKVPVRIYAIRNNPWQDPMIIRFLQRVFILRMFNYLTCVSEANKRDFLKIYAYPAEKISVIRNGVIMIESPKVSRADPNIKMDSYPVLGVVGRLTKQKGHSYILQALKKISAEYHKASLWVVGDGPLRAELQATAEALGLNDRIIWFGNRADVFDIMAQFDIYISSSLWEGIPNALLEAMAIGKPIVATAVDGVLEVLDSGCAVLVPPSEPEALAEAVLRLAMNPDLAASLASKARAKVQREFEICKIVKEYEKLYQYVYRRHQPFNEA